MRKDKETEARNWFTQAKEEFKDALDLEKRKRYYLALFLYQQATEKALKAFLFFNGGVIELAEKKIEGENDRVKVDPGEQ